MKDNNEQPNFDSSTFTRTKNLFEAIRNGVKGKLSSENAYASCGCCTKKDDYANIDGVWSQNAYSFLDKAYAPDASYDANGHLRVHPTLWNNGTNNLLSGVFEVIPDLIYQVRGYDMANITFVRSGVIKKDDGTFPKIDGNSRWIVMDTLMSKECTEAALDLFQVFLDGKYKGYTLKGKIVGAIISHSHIDHYGGIQIVSDYFCPKTTDNDGEDLPFIFVPKGFYEAAVSENVYVGNAMGRRASYQYGSFIKPKYSGTGTNINDYTTGSISIGIGQGQSTGTPSAVPSDVIEIDCNCKKTIDQIKVCFQLTPGTEAPAEMNNYFPDYNALWLAENCTGTLHNLYTLRGAQVRDAKAWANYLMETAYLYGDEAEVIFQSHNWPHWSSKYAKNLGVKEVDIKNFLIDTAAIYKYIHDQTLLYMNMGYKMNEASDMLTLPRAMQKNWCLKPFYGTPKHNSKAVYQKYLGWYDANPLHLEELPPEQLAKEMLRYMQAGSEKKVLDMIRQDIENGNYWTAAYMAHQIILSDSNNLDTAKQLCADAMQQLGYQCESGTWRNAYLSAADELRNGKQPMKQSSGSLGDMPPEMLLDYMSIFFDGERASTKLLFNGYLTVKEGIDKDNKEIVERFMFVVLNGAILYSKLLDTVILNSQNEITISKSDLYEVIKGTYSCNNILSDISKAIVNINCDRFKQFDIIGQHDSDVSFAGGKDNLKKAADECISTLQQYIPKINAYTNTVPLSDGDYHFWNEYCYPLLKRETSVILEEDFFNPKNNSEYIGQYGVFKAYELYYTLYSLLRYLYFSYLKNDFGFRRRFYDQESFVKLKKSIVLLESYVPDCYCETSDFQVKLDKEDSNAWCYLQDIPYNDEVVFSLTDFFCQLYTLYAALDIEFRVMFYKFYIEPHNSNDSIKIYNTAKDSISLNGKVIECKYTDNITEIKLPTDENTFVIEAFNISQGRKIITGHLIFHKPEIIRDTLQIDQANVSLPNPFINFDTKYTSKLYVGNEEQESAEHGRYLIGSKATIKAVSPVGFYVECSFE